MRYSKILTILLLLTGTLLAVACSSSSDDNQGGGGSSTQPITVGTPIFTDIDYFSAKITINVSGDGIIEKGFFYGTDSDPKGKGTQMRWETLSNTFTVTLGGLIPGTKYYVQGYAKDKNETKYSTVQSFTTQEQESPIPSGVKLVGGDISLLTKYVENGAVYADKDGNNLKQKYGEDYLLKFFKEQGMNTMRVRLFVDPSKASTKAKGEGVCQDLEYVKTLGKRIKDAGLFFMLDFHYSDTWADPAKQWTPSAWQGLSNTELSAKLYDYTKECLTQLKAAGAEPDLIQTGNEISYGMLWGAEGSTGNRCYTSSSDNWERFTTLLKQAGKACREVSPKARIIIHTERLAQASVLQKFYENMDSYGVDYDIIGVSYYPIYHGSLNNMDATLTQMEVKFPNRQIMIVETGYYHKWQPDGVSFDYSSYYPITDEGQRNFLTSLITILNTNHTRVTGLIWWWMEANEYGLDWNTKRVTDNWYNASLFDNETGKALPALYEMKNFK